MPTYEYRCKDCRHELEAQQSFSDDPLTECPSCGGTLKKKFTAVGISFKGSGFYKTDSRSSTNGASKSSDGDKSKDTSAGTASSSSDSGSSGSSGSSSGDSSSKSPAAAASSN
jgi:putative FmdB family regulatory protein